MTLEEILPEIRKGCGFRRAGWSAYVYFDTPTKLKDAILTINMLANDYELEPQKKELSLEEIREAFNKCVKATHFDVDWKGRFNSFAKNLGFNITE